MFNRLATEQLTDEELDALLAALLLERERRRAKTRPPSFVEDIKAGLAQQQRRDPPRST